MNRSRSMFLVSQNQVSFRSLVQTTYLFIHAERCLMDKKYEMCNPWDSITWNYTKLILEMRGWFEAIESESCCKCRCNLHVRSIYMPTMRPMLQSVAGELFSYMTFMKCLSISLLGVIPWWIRKHSSRMRTDRAVTRSDREANKDEQWPRSHEADCEQNHRRMWKHYLPLRPVKMVKYS